MPRRHSSGESRRRNNLRLIDELLCALSVSLLPSLELTRFISVIIWVKKWLTQPCGSLAILSCSHLAAPAPLPRYHAAPCQRYPSVSGMPRVQSGNRTRLLRIDTLPPTAPTPRVFGNPTPPGQGLEAGNQAGQQNRSCSRLQGLTLSIRRNCCPSPSPHPIPKSS